MKGVGQLDILVAGEKWHPVASLASCSRDDRCYMLRLGNNGVANVLFGDGEKGAKPPRDARIEARYDVGGGNAGNVGRPVSKSSLRALVDLIAEMIDAVERDLDQLYADAYIDTSEGRTHTLDLTDLRLALAGHQAEFVLHLRKRQRRRPRHRSNL
jgi:hypothetical protein